uniref:ZAD domain-containing protein n=1 Tax=Laticauda laticaudata TaxID=8630 RepID=A0A8C5S630_LATLA
MKGGRPGCAPAAAFGWGELRCSPLGFRPERLPPGVAAVRGRLLPSARWAPDLCSRRQGPFARGKGGSGWATWRARLAEAPAAGSPDQRRLAPRAGLARALGFCRLCHGKFSSRSRRNAFAKVPVLSEEAEKQRRLEQVFFADFQRLVGVAVQQDPSLPPLVCKKCHAQFYKCRGILKAFMQKVNVSPHRPCAVLLPADLITSSPQCLHQLVRWSHGHAENCPMAPSLQSVLSSKYCGIIRAVWGCTEGHNYIMSTDSDCSTLLVDSALAVQWELKDTPQHVIGNGVASDNSGMPIPLLQPQHSTARPPHFSPFQESLQPHQPLKSLCSAPIFWTELPPVLER